MELKTTPLLEEHKKLGAQTGPFGGWLMPIQYAGIIAEHTWTRQQASLFDICHMGEFMIDGDPVKSNLNLITTINVAKMACGTCRYGSMLNEQGGIIDDLVVYRIKPDRWMLVVNAARIEDDQKNLSAHLSKDSRLENVSSKLGKLDFQGPVTRDILTQLVGQKIARLTYYTFDRWIMLGEENIISRTGYTGELGYELYLSNEKIQDLWNLILKDNRVKPAGLGARDTLRLEMGYTLYGQDITEDITPLQAGLDKFIDFNKDFIGRDALLAQQRRGGYTRLVYFITHSRRAARHNYKIYSGAKQIGIVTSGSFTPNMPTSIGMGYVESGFHKPGLPITIRQDTIEIQASITTKPFYKQSTVKK